MLEIFHASLLRHFYPKTAIFEPKADPFKILDSNLPSPGSPAPNSAA